MIPHALSGLHFVEKFFSYPVVESTNEIARKTGDRPKSGLFVIQADRQTSGRGRQGATFFSNTTGGLWVSLVSPVHDLSSHFIYNRALSLAIFDTLSGIKKDAPLGIKWPNDIYWADKKICGILLQNHALYPNLLIAGFGLNINIKPEDFPSSLRPIATSLLIETGKASPLTHILHDIIECYQANFSSDQEQIHQRYLQCLYKKGSIIDIDGTQGIFDSVEPDGRLRLIQAAGTVFISSGTLKFLD